MRTGRRNPVCYCLHRLLNGVMDATEVNRGLLDLQNANSELTQAQAQWLRAELHLWLLAA